MAVHDDDDRNNHNDDNRRQGHSGRQRRRRKLVTVSIPKGTILTKTTFTAKYIQPLDMKKGPTWFSYRSYDDLECQDRGQFETTYYTKRTLKLLDVGNEKNRLKIDKAVGKDHRGGCCGKRNPSTRSPPLLLRDDTRKYHESIQAHVTNCLHLQGTYEEREPVPGDLIGPEEIVLYGTKADILSLL